MRVRIYKPTKSAAQAGRGKSHEWVVEPELLTARIPEPLMGWLSAGDTFSELRRKLKFNSKDDAIAFALRNNWDYVVEEPAERRVVPRNYLDNFRAVRPQDEERSSR